MSAHMGRRGFFATLAALPAVVMGRKAIAKPARAVWVKTEFGWRCESPGVVGDGDLVLDDTPTSHSFVINAPIGDSDAIRRSLAPIARDYEQRTVRRLGS